MSGQLNYVIRSLSIQNVTSSELSETWCMYGELYDNISEKFGVCTHYGFWACEVILPRVFDREESIESSVSD